MVCAGLVLGLIASGRVEAAQEQILSFDSEIQVHEDASMTVTETIVVHAEGRQIKRGIFRDFPQLYKGKWGLKKKTGFEVLSVLKNGQSVSYKVEKISGGTRVRIGSANVFLKPGEYTYKIKYRTDRQLGFFEEHDELYWNVTGNYWSFAIAKATARVKTPGGAPVVTHEAYTGITGAKGANYESGVEPTGDAVFRMTRALLPGEGFTVVVTWPKGFVDAGKAKTGWAEIAADNPGLNWGIKGLIAVFVYYFLAWFKVGKDPAKGVIFPRYEPPAGYSPAAVRNLYRMQFDDTAFSAGVIGLAVKGAILIKEKKKKFTLQRAGGKEGLTHDEKVLYDKLLGKAHSLSLTQTNHKRIGGAMKLFKKALSNKLEKTHFVRNLKYWGIGLIISLVPIIAVMREANEAGGAVFMTLWLTIWTVGCIALVSAAVSTWRSGSIVSALGTTLFAVPFVVAWGFGLWMLFMAAGIPVVGIFVLCALLNAVFYHLLKAPTHMGREILNHVEGFKEYLSVAEEDRLNLMNPPERTPELFEKFLPYALALDVDQEWSEQFSGVLAAVATGPGDEGSGYRPAWYSGTSSSFADFRSGSFASALGSGMTGALSSSSRAPGSSSGGGGGGSSGGGGGGGGGGGW